MSDKEIANTIFQQLGGNKFLAMTGAHSASIANRGMSVKLPRNKSKAQYLCITLADDDTYTMTFTRFSKEYQLLTVKQVEGVYCDMMGSIFEETTGLATRL